MKDQFKQILQLRSSDLTPNMDQILYSQTGSDPMQRCGGLFSMLMVPTIRNLTSSPGASFTNMD